MVYQKYTKLPEGKPEVLLHEYIVYFAMKLKKLAMSN